METPEVAIVGAGAAGLATAALLRDAGVEALVLEAGPEPGAAWRGHYDRLHLHTPRLLSGLPGRRIPRRYGRWVSRDDLLAYLRDYAEGLDVRTNERVERIERDGDAWRLETAHGPLASRAVIVATGYNGEPFVPDWTGREDWSGWRSSTCRRTGSTRSRRRSGSSPSPISPRTGCRARSTGSALRSSPQA